MHVIAPSGQLAVPKVRAFVDFAVPLLRRHFACLAKAVGENGPRPRLAVACAEPCAFAPASMAGAKRGAVILAAGRA